MADLSLAHERPGGADGLVAPDRQGCAGHQLADQQAVGPRRRLQLRALPVRPLGPAGADLAGDRPPGMSHRLPPPSQAGRASPARAPEPWATSASTSSSESWGKSW